MLSLRVPSRRTPGICARTRKSVARSSELTGAVPSSPSMSYHCHSTGCPWTAWPAVPLCGRQLVQAIDSDTLLAHGPQRGTSFYMRRRSGYAYLGSGHKITHAIDPGQVLGVLLGRLAATRVAGKIGLVVAHLPVRRAMEPSDRRSVPVPVPDCRVGLVRQPVEKRCRACAGSGLAASDATAGSTAIPVAAAATTAAEATQRRPNSWRSAGIPTVGASCAASPRLSARPVPAPGAPARRRAAA